MTETYLTDFFAADHARLELILDTLIDQLDKDMDIAKGYFEAYCDGLVKHTEWEESVLLPIFKQLASNRDSLDDRVKTDHLEIKHALLDAMDKMSTGKNPAKSLKVLAEKVKRHHRMEEQYFHSEIDSVITKEDCAKVFLGCYQMSNYGSPEH